MRSIFTIINLFLWILTAACLVGSVALNPHIGIIYGVFLFGGLYMLTSIVQILATRPEVEVVHITEVVGQDGGWVAAPCQISGCQYKTILSTKEKIA